MTWIMRSLALLVSMMPFAFGCGGGPGSSDSHRALSWAQGTPRGTLQQQFRPRGTLRQQVTPQEPRRGTLRQQEPPQGKGERIPAGLRRAYIEARMKEAAPGYAFARRAQHGFEARCAGQKLSIRIGGRAVKLGSSRREAFSAELALAGLGRPGAIKPVATAVLQAEGNQVTLDRGSVTEWYRNGPSGLEQGFDITHRPAGNGLLKILVAVGGDVTARLDRVRRRIVLEKGGRDLLAYSHLEAWDSTGRRLDAWFGVEQGQIALLVDDAKAQYPVTVDPLVWQVQQKLVAVDGAAHDHFGNSVALDGDSAVVGAPFDYIGSNLDQGSAYVFVRTGTSWAQQQKLTAPDGEAYDFFGTSVAISGDTLVVGAPADDIGSNSNQGSAYVFVRSGTTWALQQKLTAPEGEANDLFGISVAISGDTLVVGVDLGDTDSNSGRGAAYVFVRSGTTWALQQKLTASGDTDHDSFGEHVAISGDTLVVTAQYDDIGSHSFQGSAYVFVRSETSWELQQRVTAWDGVDHGYFGGDVAISGDILVVGAPYDTIGSDLKQGSAYVFVRSGTIWSQEQKLTASDGKAQDWFGTSVAISGDALVVGAWGDDIGSNSGQGSAYVFVRSGTIWSQEQKLTASDGEADDWFGTYVAISGNTLVVGAWGDNIDSNPGQGSAYVFNSSLDLDLGAPCSIHRQCISGHCVDGVCCDTECSGQCEACDLAGSEGTCSAVQGAPHGDRPACEGSNGCQGSCDGSDRRTCVFPGEETVCAEAVCFAGWAGGEGRCDGEGHCQLPKLVFCKPYICADNSCLSSCSDDSQCLFRYQCVEGECQPKGTSSHSGCGCATDTPPAPTGLVILALFAALLCRRRDQPHGSHIRRSGRIPDEQHMGSRGRSGAPAGDSDSTDIDKERNRNRSQLMARAGITTAFGRRSTPAGCVARRLNTSMYSPSSRLASRAPRRPRCFVLIPARALSRPGWPLTTVLRGLLVLGLALLLLSGGCGDHGAGNGNGNDGGVCGDGVKDPGEGCDDGNRDNTDACPDGEGGTCMRAFCGDGFVLSGYEECDDGNGDNTDACPDGEGGTCMRAFCGDGFVWSGHEDCDSTDLGSLSCTSLDQGFTGGLLACGANCHFDTSGCRVSPGFTWVSIPGGSFQLGSTTGGLDEQPVHQVTVPAFEMTKTEVTVAEYAACVTAGSCTEPRTGMLFNWNDPGYEDHPVNGVTWQQAVDFCAWAGGRLPSEAEWEYAARSAGQAVEYPWGDDTATCTYAVMDDDTHSYGCDMSRTWPVCSKPAGNTSQGLCDMAGNVWEWVQDWYHSSYTDAPTDGSAWESPSGSSRVLRGGSFGSHANGLRAANRYGDAAPNVYAYVGFRCAKDAP